MSNPIPSTTYQSKFVAFLIFWIGIDGLLLLVNLFAFSGTPVNKEILGYTFLALIVLGVLFPTLIFVEHKAKRKRFFLWLPLWSLFALLLWVFSAVLMVLANNPLFPRNYF